MVDYRGFRISCTPCLPLRENGLFYGSDDMGKTIHNADTKFQGVMETCARALHLAGHVVGEKTFYSAGDVHAYSGSDNRCYLLHLARCFPPESPSQCRHLPQDKCGVPILYRLLRPEYLQHVKHEGLSPLSADALSNWGKANADIHNKRVEDASKHLCNEVIPNLAKELDAESRYALLGARRGSFEVESPLPASYRPARAKALAPLAVPVSILFELIILSFTRSLTTGFFFCLMHRHPNNCTVVA
jgi:hypothetical protein